MCHASLQKHLEQQLSSPLPLWGKPWSFGDPTVIFCFRCQTKVPISEKDLEDVVIFLTSSKPGNFISPEDVIDCQKQWLDMRKGQCQETRTGERRALAWESISTRTGNA